MSEYKYKAFISYRHLEPDMQAAEKLQKLLENYKPPKKMVEKNEKWRIFRDVSELQSSSDLSEDIKNAVENSEYLIVICSPEYNQSKWCLQEITRFRELHGNTNENIITLLVKGPPKEAFPEQLTYTEVKTVDDNGNETTVKVEVEPLAANITADSLKESMKKLNTEYLRIAAPLLGCDFNDLFQREKRREAARRRRIFGGVSGVLSVITLISVISALTINNKNKQIQKQNDQIKSQNEQIEKKNNDLLIENSEHLAAESEKLYKDNSLISAIQKALEAMPSDGEEKPIVPEAEYALSREMGMFKSEQIIPQLSLKHETAVEKLSFMGQGKTIVSQDSTGIYFWNAESGELLKKISASDSDFASDKYGSSNELTSIFEINDDKTGTYFSSTAAPGNLSYQISSVLGNVYVNYAHDVSDDEPGTGDDVYIYNSEYKLWKFDGATGDIKWCSELSENAYSYYQVTNTDNYIVRFYQDKNVIGSSEISMPGSDLFMEIIDRKTGNVTDTVNVSSLEKGTFSILQNNELQDIVNNTVYFYNNDKEAMIAYSIKDHKLEEKCRIVLPEFSVGSIRTAELNMLGNDPVIVTNDIFALKLNANIKRMDNDMKEVLWSTDIPVNYTSGSKIFKFNKDESGSEIDVLGVVTNRTISLLDYNSGKLIKTISLDSEIVDVSFSRRGLIMFTVSTGEEYVISINSYLGDSSRYGAYKIQNFNTGISLCSYSRGRYVTSEMYSNTAYIQYIQKNEFFNTINAGENIHDYNVFGVSEDGKYAVVSAVEYPDTEKYTDSDLVKHFYIFHTDEEKCYEIEALKGYTVCGAEFADGNKIIAALSNSVMDKRLVIIDALNGNINDFSGDYDFQLNALKMIPYGNSVYYTVNNNRDLLRACSDGTISLWSGEKEINIMPEREICNGVADIYDDKAAVFYTDNTDQSRGIEVYSFTDGKRIKMDFDFSSDDGLNVNKLFWQNSSTIGAFMSDRSVVFFNAETGDKKAEISLDGTSQEPLSVIPIDEDRFAVLCRDLCLYEMNSEGFTGRSLKLEIGIDERNGISENDSEKASLLITKQSTDTSCIYVIWSNEKAWLINKDKFKVRYSIDDFVGAPSNSDKVFILDMGRDKAGYMPIYAPQQLIDTAKSYIARLFGEVLTNEK
ncbi:MTH538 TIR-like domain [Ruminococcus flavefaciens]|uniref:MTH538 TIR-like domain n=1 Tax=Ruminococcus flavefaciens TaxID=1265 RepID=A0A1H6LME1_RUMFL|nr:TIR domain-containing protein [Ruminococcus flavefaciens]SEH87486.1 MTH538 TIR-like domain [Ruminococcus flavefaciens]